MKRLTCAVLSLAAAGLATPVLACPGVVPCVPSACFDMHRAQIRGRGVLDGSLDFTSLNVTLLSQVPLTSMGGTATTDGSSMYAWVDPLTSKEYAIFGRSNGTAIVDVTNPTLPKYVANVPSIGGVNTIWREPKVYGNYAYVGVDGSSHRMQIVDLTQVRSYTGTTLQLNYGTYTIAGGGTQVTKIHTLGINPQSGFLYAAGTNLNGGGLHVIDVRNPATPVAAGNTNLDGYTHETQVVTYSGPDPQHQGKEIAFNSNGNNGVLSILDVTNKSAITRISARTYTGERYIHQGWLTADQKYFFQDDELDEPSPAAHTRTHLWNVSDLDNPVYKGFWDNTTTSIDHNLYVKGNFVYETNYTTGLRILKIGDLEGASSQWLTEVAWFDTFPSSDAAVFDGAWNNYPYLPSGNILVSDISGGLFVLRANLPGPPVGDFIKKDLWNGTSLVPEPGSMAILATCVALLGQRRRLR